MNSATSVDVDVDGTACACRRWSGRTCWRSTVKLLSVRSTC